MNRFEDLNIKTGSDLLTGEKIKISRVINKEIVITGFKIEESKYPKNKSGKCLFLQIELENEKRIIFTGANALIDVMIQVKKDNLPIKTMIVQEGEHYEFK